MSRADYAHWNEDADYVWWHEEGKHADDSEFGWADDLEGDDVDRFEDDEDDEDDAAYAERNLGMECTE